MRKLKPAQVSKVRNHLLAKQGARCAICKQPLAEDGATLDHCHKTGYIRDVLCRNCNGLEGKIWNLCNRGKRKYDVFWFLHAVRDYWVKHEGIPDHGLMYPTHKTAEDKRIRTNTLARKKRAAAKVNDADD